MFKKCIALLTAFVLLLTPMTAGAVTWGDIMTGIDTTGSFSGGGTTAVKEGIDTITVSGGEVEFEYDKLGENYYKRKDTISKDGTYVFSKVTLTSTDSLSIPIIVDYGSNLKDSIKVKLEDSVTLNSGVDVGLFDPDGTIILENYADIKGGTGPDGTPLEAISIHISDATGGTAKFEMKGNGTLSSGSYPVKATYYVVVDNTEDDTTAIKNAFLNQIDLASIQNTQQLYAFEEGEGGQYRLILFDGDTGERKTTDSASLGLSALATTTPEVPSETPIPEQPDTTPAPEQPDTTPAPEQPDTTPAPEATPEPTPAPEQEDNGPSEEQIRHEMEMKRQEEAVGGITGSPYWCSQLFLNYHSRNLWLHDAEGRKVNFREHISWEGEYPNKRLLLRVNNMASTDGLTMRFDEETLNAFDKSGIVTVILANTVNGQVEPFMQYSVSDLRAAREQYGLAPEELLVVGGMDDEVMKSAIGGTPVPVE